MSSPPPWLDRTEYPFRSQFIELPSAGRVHYVDEGPSDRGRAGTENAIAAPDGDPIVLVHGPPTWSFEYRHLIGQLSPTRRVIALDHLGFGLSARPADFGYR